MTAFKDRRAVSMASLLVRFIKAPEWMITRPAPIHPATRQAPVM